MADVDGQAKIWLAVRPTVGLPLLLISVALTAVILHAAVLGNAVWFKKYLNGGNKTIAITQPAPIPAPAVTAPQVR